MAGCLESAVSLWNANPAGGGGGGVPAGSCGEIRGAKQHDREVTCRIGASPAHSGLTRLRGACLSGPRSGVWPCREGGWCPEECQGAGTSTSRGSSQSPHTVPSHTPRICKESQVFRGLAKGLMQKLAVMQVAAGCLALGLCYGNVRAGKQTGYRDRDSGAGQHAELGGQAVGVTDKAPPPPVPCPWALQVTVHSWPRTTPHNQS